MSASLRAGQPEITHGRASARVARGRSPSQKAAARATARPLILAWLKSVEAKVRTKKLKDLDYRLAVILTNFPSANDGKCWPGQKYLAGQAGRCERTIREALGRLENEGLLKTRRGGQGYTSCYTYAIDGCEVFDRQRDSALDRQQAAALDRQQAAAKPSELKPTEQESPPTPSHRADVIDLVAERRVRRPAITGYEFLDSCHRVKGCRTGPALAEWSRLSTEDRQAIWRIIERDGAIDLEGLDMWAFTYLKSRTWKRLVSEPSKSAVKPFADRVFVQENTPQWHAWSRHYHEHGAPNGTRVGPASFSYEGKQGNFFAGEWPPQ
jgi:hypothetical protein